MKIIVKAKTSSKYNKVEKIDENNYIVYVKQAPVDGKANIAIFTLLAEYFNTKTYLVKILSGYWSKTKVIEITKL